MKKDPEIESLITLLQCVAECPERFSQDNIRDAIQLAADQIRLDHPLPNDLPPTSCDDQMSIYDGGGIQSIRPGVTRWDWR